MTSTDIGQQILDQIAEEFSDAIRCGDNPAIAAFLEKYPDHSDQLPSLLASIAMIEGLKQATDRSTATINHQPLPVTQLDDYRLIREIGRGGMGVVFEAMDQSLHRRVAIKVLPHSLVSDPRNLDRFRREAKAAARLRHPNIVSVFGVGQAGEYHYYVMDYIDGLNLREWLLAVTHRFPEATPTRDAAISDADRAGSLHDTEGTASDETGRRPINANIPLPADAPDYFRWIANIGLMISDALEYAHSQGTLHRDIKPANLLMDHQGNVSITDFGLAKVAEHQGVTRTGDILGTPQYMAPESFAGHYDARSETYAVGLTLYELLTLRPAISASSPAQLIRHATNGMSLDPRKLNASIPRDLETIVLKSLAVSPDARYATAGELRDDLRCFLDDLPISARRSNLLERVVRWSRREPVIASLTLATFSSLFALAIVAATAYLRTKSALDDAETSKQSAITALAERTDALQVAEQQRLRAEANLSVAIDAFDQIKEDVWRRGTMPDAEILGEVVDSASPDVSAADAQILQSLLGFFDDLAANNSNDLRAESAAAARLAGDIYQRLGQLANANRAYSDALRRYESLASENPDSDAFVVDQAQVLNELIVTASLQGQVQRASILFDQTIQILTGSDAEGSQTKLPSSPESRFEYARAHALFASIVARAGVDAASLRRVRSAARTPGRPLMNAMAFRSEQELSAISEAIGVLSELVDEYPAETKYHVTLARAYRDQSKVAARAGLSSEAERAIKESIDHFESLLADNNGSDSIRYELAKTLSSSEALSLNQMIRILRADSLSEMLLKQSPTLPRYQALRAHVLEVLAVHRHRLGKSASAEKNLRDALKLYDALIEAAPDLLLYKTKKSQTLETFADLKLRDGDRTAAIGYLQSAIRELQPSSRSADASAVARIQLQKQRQKLSRISDPGNAP